MKNPIPYLIICGFLIFGCALAQDIKDAAKPEVPPDQIIVAIKAENAYLKEKLRLTELKLALVQAYNRTEADLATNEAKKPAEKAVPITPEAK